jgi:tetratricopeptide (TPR) repeat protein
MAPVAVAAWHTRLETPNQERSVHKSTRRSTAASLALSFSLTFCAGTAEAKNAVTLPIDQLPQPDQADVLKAKTTALFSRPVTNTSDSKERQGTEENRSPGNGESSDGAPSNSHPSSKLEVGSVSRQVETAGKDSDAWKRYYDAGLIDLASRRYETAEDRFNASIKAARLGMGDDEKILLSRIRLAQVYMAQKKYAEAEKLFSSCQPSAKKVKGAASPEFSACNEGLAELALLNGKRQKAELLIDQALEIRNKVDGPSATTAKCMMLKAQILSQNNWVEQAEETALQAVKMMRDHPSKNQMDVADVLRKAALLFHEHGKTSESQELFERSYHIIDEAARLNMPPQVEGEIDFVWEVGSPRAQEIPDSDFPLKYMQIDNVRVAATVIDLWELYGVIISITNIGNERVSLGLGKPVLFGANSDLTHPHLEKLSFIDPGSIDRIRRERVMWDLTQNRPWLANMQKTRSQRGFVPSSGHDLFRGPNVFGIYGEWAALPRELPTKLMLEPSPERVQYQAETKIDPGLVRSSTIKIRNLIPISLEPFESRTGELFFLNPRCERLELTVPVGNVIYQIPFTAKRKRIK